MAASFAVVSVALGVVLMLHLRLLLLVIKGAVNNCQRRYWQRSVVTV